MRSLRFVTASRCDEDEFRSTPIFRSLGGRYDLYAALGNSEGLPKVYNRFLDGDFGCFRSYGPRQGEHDASDLAVFIHDDVEMLGNNVEEELNSAVDSGFALAGLAGGKRPTIRSPALWNLMTREFERSGVSVFQNWHHAPNGGTHRIVDYPLACRFGPLREVDLLDGLFLGVATDEANRVGLRFDEAFQFHHYDLSFCLRAKAAGLRMRTVFVPVIHWSSGLSDLSDPLFQESDRAFLAKYG
jgi:hypothetical protein